MTSAVTVHITIVSKNTSNTAHMPCSHGSFASAAVCTMTDEPSPASLENTPRDTPVRMARAMP